MTKTLLALSLAFLASCGIDHDTETDDDLATEDGDDTSVTEQAVYSPWYYLSAGQPNYHWSVSLRACKTATRINWQFANNTFWNVATDGDGISYINTYIQGVSSGSKYRTRAGTVIWWNFYSAGYGVGKTLSISEIPNC